ncbi:MAG: hypothetical protein ACRDD1_04485 [Planctomycetia bacterium]
MDTFEEASPAQKSAGLHDAVCWECGENKLCYEYVVCCTGTMFHVCPDCEESKMEEEEAEAVVAAGDAAGLPACAVRLPEALDDAVGDPNSIDPAPASEAAS